MKGVPILTEEGFAMQPMFLKEDPALKEDQFQKNGPVQKNGLELKRISEWPYQKQKPLMQP